MRPSSTRTALLLSSPAKNNTVSELNSNRSPRRWEFLSVFYLRTWFGHSSGFISADTNFSLTSQSFNVLPSASEGSKPDDPALPTSDTGAWQHLGNSTDVEVFLHSDSQMVVPAIATALLTTEKNVKSRAISNKTVRIMLFIILRSIYMVLCCVLLILQCTEQ